MSDKRNGKTFSFDVCEGCKTMCCQGANPPLTAERRKILKAFLKERGRSADDVFVQEAYLHPAADGEEYCAFFDKASGKCSVHAVKPETCVAGPITFDVNLRTGKVEWFLKKGTICRFAEQLYAEPERFAAHLEAAKPQLLRLICGLDADALRAILGIPEPETFKVGENDLPKEARRKLGFA